MDKQQRLQLLEPFRKAGIRAEVAKVPILPARDQRSVELIFQMDIQNRATNFETLRIWPGAENNDVRVTGIDRRLTQAVLSVKEPERTFEVTQTFWSAGELMRALRNPRVRLVSQKQTRTHGVEAVLELTTPTARQRFLVGKDERFYFVANCPGHPTTVFDAHNALRPQAATRKDTERQGEWFFIPFTPREAAGMERLLRKAPIHHHVSLLDLRDTALPLRQRQRQFPLGDHFAEKLYVSVRDKVQMAQGAITHRRHRKLLLHDWHKVEHNLEIPNPFNVRWVD